MNPIPIVITAGSTVFGPPATPDTYLVLLTDPFSTAVISVLIPAFNIPDAMEQSRLRYPGYVPIQAFRITSPQ